MYDIAKKARAGMKAKAERLAGEKDRKTDSSDWSPPEPLNADVKTGMRPVSRKAYKKGGAVKGEMSKVRADRMPRKAGGKVEAKGEQPLVDRYINRDLKKANDYRDGKKHKGALKRGGRAAKADGGGSGVNDPSHTYDIGVSSGKEKKNLSVSGSGDFNENLNRWLKTAKKAGWDIDSVKHTGTSYPGTSAGLMKRGGRAKKADGGMTMEEMIKKNPAPEKKPLGLDKVPLPPRRPENLTPAANNPIKPDMKKYMPGDVITGPPKKYKEMPLPRGSKPKYENMPLPRDSKPSYENMKKGGRAKKADGGMMMDPRLGIVKNKAFEFGQNTVVPGLKKGGRAEKANGGSTRARFNEAFKAARAAYLAGEGPKIFEFEGQKYGTDLYKPTTGPSTRGRGATAPAPMVKKNITVKFGTAPLPADQFSKSPKAPMSMASGQPVTEAQRRGAALSKAQKAYDEVKNEATASGQFKKGGRIAKQIGGALGRAAGALNRSMPNVPASAPAMGQMGIMGSPNQGNFGGRGPAPQAFDRAQGRPFQGGQFMPPGRGDGMTRPGFGMRRPMPINGGMAYPGGSQNFDESTGMYRNPPTLQSVPFLGPISGTASPLTQTGAMSNLGMATPQMQQTSGLQAMSPQQAMDAFRSNPLAQMSPQDQFAFNAQQAAASGNPYPEGASFESSLGPQGITVPMTYANGGRIARANGGEINEPSESKHKSKSKGKDTHVNIVIAMGKGDQQDMGQQMPMNPPPPPPPMAMNAPPAPMGGAPMPPPATGGGMPPMPPDLMGAAPMPRKAGGRVSKVAKSYKDMTVGAGSGEGRLQKTDIAKRTAHKSGGKVYRSYKDMDAGAGSGEGRLEKTEIQKRKK